MMIILIALVAFVQSVTLGLIIKIYRDMRGMDKKVKFRLAEFENMIKSRIAAFLEVFRISKGK